MDLPEERKSLPIYVLAASITVLALFWLGVWFLGIAREAQYAKLRVSLLRSVEIGNAIKVLDLLERIDPEGFGTVADWTGEGEDTKTGFVWLAQRWRELQHPAGEIEIFERWALLNPSFPRQELVTHLDWLRSTGQDQRFHNLFLSIFDLVLNQRNDLKNQESLEWISVISSDTDLVFEAWELHRQSRCTVAFPKSVAASVIDPGKLEDTETIAKLLRVTGLLDAPEDFELLMTPLKSSPQTWIEWLYRETLAPSEPSYQTLKTALERYYLPNCDPNTPGLYLLRCISEDSRKKLHPRISQHKAQLALKSLDRLKPEAKPQVAGFLARHLLGSATTAQLREWLWFHYEPVWSHEGQTFAEMEELDMRSATLGGWFRTAVKLGQAERAAPVIAKIWRRKVDDILSGNQPSAYLPAHPFEVVPGWVMDDASFLHWADPALFETVIALAKQPGLYTDNNFPAFTTLMLSDGRSIALNDAPREELFTFLNRVGTRYRDEPVRFAIVPLFRKLTFQSGADLTAFQIAAQSVDTPGGWLIKDIAGMTTLRYCNSPDRLEAVEEAGGTFPDFRQFNAYFNDDRTPASARLTLALQITYPDSAKFFRKRSPDSAGIPRIEANFDQLASDFAEEYSQGRWPEELFSHLLDSIVGSWILSKSSPGTTGDIEARGKAMARIRTRLETIIPAKLVLADHIQGEDPAFVEVCVLPVLRNYSAILRLEGRGFDLIQLWKALERSAVDPYRACPWIPDSVSRTDQVLDFLGAFEWSSAFRKTGSVRWPDPSSGMHYASFGATIAEAGAQLSTEEWMRFCNRAIQKTSRSNEQQWNQFYAIPPLELVIQGKNETDDDRIQRLLEALTHWTETPENENFFRLALPVVFQHILKTRTASQRLGRMIAEDPGLVGSSLAREAIEAISDSAGNAPDPSRLAALRDPSVPLAQRWVSANQFLIHRLEEDSARSGRSENRAEIDRILVETATDLLLEGIEMNLRVWSIVDRGLSYQELASHERVAVLTSFRNLFISDRGTQSGRASRILEPSVVDAILEGPGHPARAAVLHSLAMEWGNQQMATEILTLHRGTSGFVSRFKLLNGSQDWMGMSEFLARDWRGLVSARPEDGLWLREGALPEILEALPDDPDLRLLIDIHLQISDPPHWFSFGPPVTDNPVISSLVNRFCTHTFRSKEMERYCLYRLNPRLRQDHSLEGWIRARLQDRSWQVLLEQDTKSFLEDWELWAKWIELMVDKGDFAAVRQLIPDSNWFLGVSRSLAQMPAGRGETREEMVWMGFARALAQCLTSGPIEHRSQAAKLVATLLDRPPVLNLGKEPEFINWESEIPERGRWTVHAAAIQDLSELGQAQIVLSSLSRFPELQIGEMERFRLPLRTRGPLQLISDRGVQSFVDWVLILGKDFTDSEKDQLILRVFETMSLQDDNTARMIPCYKLLRYPGSQRIPRETLLRLAKIRFDENPEDPLRIADYGHMLFFSNERDRSLALLERAVQLLDANDVYQLSLREDIRSLLIEARTRQ